MPLQPEIGETLPEPVPLLETDAVTQALIEKQGMHCVPRAGAQCKGEVLGVVRAIQSAEDSPVISGCYGCFL